MLTTCSWVKGFAALPSKPGLVPAAVVALTLRSARNGATGILPVLGHGQDGHGTSKWRDKLAAMSACADLKVGATTSRCAHAGRAETNAVARMRKVSVLGNLIATS